MRNLALLGLFVFFAGVLAVAQETDPPTPEDPELSPTEIGAAWLTAKAEVWAKEPPPEIVLAAYLGRKYSGFIDRHICRGKGSIIIVKRA